MTSEVLILNKHAVVLAADSAVTTTPASDGEHPRYSKTANKLFELCDEGNVAVMIYGGAQIDLVPWELAIKLYRKGAGSQKLATFDQYLDRLLAFVQSHATLFPSAVRSALTDARLEMAGKHILSIASAREKAIFDPASVMAQRQASWAKVAAALGSELDQKSLPTSLTDASYQAALAASPGQVPSIAQKLSGEPELAAIDPAQLAELAVKALYKSAIEFLPSTGVVVAGYGQDDIFPGYRTVEVYGHIGTELLWKEIEKFQITHSQSSMIKALAQTSMIDVFTDGFGFSLWRILNRANKEGLQDFVGELIKQGATIPPAKIGPAIDGVRAPRPSAS